LEASIFALIPPKPLESEGVLFVFVERPDADFFRKIQIPLGSHYTVEQSASVKLQDDVERALYDGGFLQRAKILTRFFNPIGTREFLFFAVSVLEVRLSGPFVADEMKAMGFGDRSHVALFLDGCFRTVYFPPGQPYRPFEEAAGPALSLVPQV
jgi:hypothetical protein